MPENRIPEDRLLDAFGRMALIRVFEEAFRDEVLAGRSRGFNHVYSGQEACAVALCMHLEQADAVMSSHRAQGHYIAKCGDVEALAREMIGRVDGCSGGKGGSMHVCRMSHGVHGGNGIIGASAPHAVGAAMAFHMRGEARVAVAFLGDGASNQGGFLESLNLASVYRLPVVFVVEDNGFAESTASSWAIGGYDLVARAAGFGIPGIMVEAVDFPEVYGCAGRAVAAARDGQGPQLLHVKVPMFYGHYVGDPELYRAKGEARRQRKDADCVGRLAALLRDDYGVEAARTNAIVAEARERVTAAFSQALADPPQSPEALTAGVFQTSPTFEPDALR